LAETILSESLSTHVPEDVRNLFEVAQGVMCYGRYFYPLYTLGTEQFYRVHEAALAHKCQSEVAPPTVMQFRSMLDWLLSRGFLTDSQFAQWNAVREPRNEASHAKQQTI
jgi:hypothetical protein